MIAQIVFDLPLDGPFDYLIPEDMVPRIKVGARVKVSFGPRPQIGFVVGLLAQSTISKLKPIQSLCDASAVFNSLDLAFAREFCSYYGCSLGEALGAMFRNKENHRPSLYREHKPGLTLYRCQPDAYLPRIQEIIKGYPPHSRFLILVPDAFRGEMLFQQFKGAGSIKLGMRSSVFESDGHYDCVIMVDEEDASYKQEQTPMYDTTQVLLTRSKIFGFDIAFVGISPSVELMAMVREGLVRSIETSGAGVPSARLIDLTNYKFIPGLISPPVRDALEAALKAGKKGILVLNRRGSYRLTRCVDCGEILKCIHCDSALIFSRSEGKFLCRHCTYTAPGSTVCPKCRKSSWKSIGIGVEQVQTELKKQFPQARIIAFERETGSTVKTVKPVSDFDILITTQAVLRFQGRWQVGVAAFIDFDAELNRLDMRSAFKAFSLALHISSMALESVFIQTRNSGHYVLQHLSRGKIQGFYDDELKLRKELGFSPFKHWVKISWRGKSEKFTQEASRQVYNELGKAAPENYTITPPLADAVGRKRGQFRFNVMVQADDVSQAVALIKSVLAGTKRPSRVILTFNIDP